jgi:hypothetical protein
MVMLNDDFERRLLLNYEVGYDEQGQRLLRRDVLESRLAELAGDPSMSQAVWIWNAALPVH